MSKPSGRAEPMATAGAAHLTRTIVSGLLLLPFLVNLTGRTLGFEIFYVADPKVQAAWGTLALFGGLPLFRQAAQHLRQGGHAAAFWSAILSAVIYGTSLYTALLRPEAGTIFSLSALLIFVHFTVQWLSGRRRD